MASTEKQVEKNFTWVIQNPTSLYDRCSDQFLIAGCKWRLVALPRKNNLEFFYEYCGASDSQSLPPKWRRHVKLRLSILNRLYERYSLVTDSELYFDEKSPTRRYPTVLPPPKLLAEDGGFLESGKLTIVVEVVAHEVIGTLGELQDSKLLGRIEETRDAKSNVKERVDVNGFQVLPSQVESVKRIFERYPDIASEVRAKKPCLKTTYMNVLLGLIETLCQLPEELSDDDMEEASGGVSYVAKIGFKVDWLEKKLEEVKARKKKVNIGKARLHRMEEELRKYNQKRSDLKALVEKENVPLSFDDVV